MSFDRELQALRDQGVDVDGKFWDKNDDRVAVTLCDLLSDLNNLDDQLVRAASDLADVAARVQRYVAEGLSVNSLGELQSRGANFDRLCSLREAKSDQVVKTAWAFGLDGKALLAARKAVA